MNENTNDAFVMVELDTYGKMIAMKERANILIKILFQTARLNYSKDGLSFSDSALDECLKAIAPELYEARFEELKGEQ